MKKKIFITLIIGIIIGITAAALAYFITAGKVEWREYIETKLIPIAVAAIGAVGTLYIGATPVLNLVKTAAGHFIKASENVSLTVENGKKTDATLEGYDKKITEFEEQIESNIREYQEKTDKTISSFIGRFDSTDEMLQKLEKIASRIDDIMLLGFCNIDELVKKGYAAEIMKVGARNEKNTESKG